MEVEFEKLNRRPEYTAQEFERDYAEASGVTLAFLKEHTRQVAPCHCDYEECRGWQMTRLCEEGA